MSEQPEAWRENVAAIVVDAAGRVLLGCAGGAGERRHLPQGGVERRETLEEALRRELWEEVGLAPDRYRIVAAYGGLRYRYRKDNDKRERWRGQQQTYFLLQCYGEMPPTDCSGSEEFERVEWLSLAQLGPALFPKSRREAVSSALAHFFPPVGAPPAFAFAGGKEEAALHLERLSLTLCRLQKQLEACGAGLLIILHGQAGTGRRQAVRRLAALMDPLRLRILEAACPLLPAAGECALLPGDGHVLPPFAGPCLRLWLTLGDAPAPGGWLPIPSDRRWYRDLLLAQAVAGALAQPCLVPPLAAQQGSWCCMTM